MSERKEVGCGHFTWSPGERQTDRYGSFMLTKDCHGMTVPFKIDEDAIEELKGKKVHITCQVIESRKSQHMGDLYHGFTTKQPKQGEIIDLGVFIFEPKDDEFHTFVLNPGDDRKHFWIDPRKLYQLIDQTVALFVAETDRPFTPYPPGLPE